MVDLTPHQIVAELDRYIVGQQRAKKAVAVPFVIGSGGESSRNTGKIGRKYFDDWSHRGG